MCTLELFVDEGGDDRYSTSDEFSSDISSNITSRMNSRLVTGQGKYTTGVFIVL